MFPAARNLELSSHRIVSNMRWSVCLLAKLALVAMCTNPAKGADSAQVERGKYLVKFGGCNDCHTPGYFLGKPDTARFLGGSDVGFEVPGLGTFVGRNLTPDKDTGLGNWTKEEIITAFQTGVRPDGRVLGPPMPWRSYAGLTQSDANAIADYLRSLPPVHQAIPGPFGPGEKVRVLRLTILPPDDISQPK